MDALIKKFEEIFTKFLADFEKNPLSVGIKVLLIFWLLKEAHKQLNKK